MNVIELTQSFQSVVESISTTNPADQYVSKDLFQTCMASFANNIIELAQSLNQLSWGLKTGVETLSNKLDNLEGTSKCFHNNNAKLSDRVDSCDSNNLKILNSIRKLSDRVENSETINKQTNTEILNTIRGLSDKVEQVETINKQQTEVFFERLNNLEGSNYKIQDSIIDLSDRLHAAESSITSCHHTTVQLS